MNTSPPLMRYVATKDGCVEKLQDTLQPTKVPALAAAAMAAAKEGLAALHKDSVAGMGDGASVAAVAEELFAEVRG